jgi:ribosomal protein S18 acetylase RimI-like enzyme
VSICFDPDLAAAPAHPLDNPARAALLGPHRHLARVRGRVRCYPADVSPFIGFPDDPGPADWRDLAALLGPGSPVPVPGLLADLPPGWEVLHEGVGVQLVDHGVPAVPDTEAVPLGPADVPEMLALVARTEPGPFRPRTVLMGGYLGIRRGGELVAMAGERLHPPGWTEISAVCTDPAHRGRGLATRLVCAVAAGIRARGETPFLHAAATNVTAIRLYESLGFRLRRRTVFRTVRVPCALAPAPFEEGVRP